MNITIINIINQPNDTDTRLLRDFDRYQNQFPMTPGFNRFPMDPGITEDWSKWIKDNNDSVTHTGWDNNDSVTHMRWHVTNKAF